MLAMLHSSLRVDTNLLILLIIIGIEFPHNTEIIATMIAAGSENYLQWLHEVLKQP